MSTLLSCTCEFDGNGSRTYPCPVHHPEQVEKNRIAREEWASRHEKTGKTAVCGHFTCDKVMTQWRNIETGVIFYGHFH